MFKNRLAPQMVTPELVANTNECHSLSDKPGRNDPCWCGSGRKFKHCHLRRAAEPSLPPKAISSQMRKSSAHRTCLHPDASEDTCGRVISAHTLQRSRVLETIADDDNHVLTFYPSELESGGRMKVHRRGWRQASTFDAFCDRHDGTAFAPLETVPFSGTKEQIFLIAYRAICWELYQKTRAVKSGPVLHDLVDRGASEHIQREIQEIIGVQDAGFRKGLADFESIKHEMDEALTTSDFSSFSAHEFVLEGPVSVVATGAISPNLTLSGVPIQTLHDKEVRIQLLAFGVDVTERGANVVFLWSNGDDAPLTYIEEIAGLDDKQLAEFLVQFFFAHCENTYFAATWWDALSEDDQSFVDSLMQNANPYYFPPEYELNRSLAPWRLVSQSRL